ncbi:MAG: hypothetical protein ABSF59_16525 [Candidatus Sulfotelmatobacter sp.]|jgi:hypothetical protein
MYQQYCRVACVGQGSPLLGALFWFGVAGILVVGQIDLLYVFWPASVILVVGWHSTIFGMMITASALAIHCLLYMAVAYFLRVVVRLVAPVIKAR